PKPTSTASTCRPPAPSQPAYPAPPATAAPETARHHASPSAAARHDGRLLVWIPAAASPPSGRGSTGRQRRHLPSPHSRRTMDFRFFALSRWLLFSAAARGAASQQLLRGLGTKWEP